MAPVTELRHAISALLDAGKTPTVIVRTLGCSRSVVYKVKNLKEVEGGDLGRKFSPRQRPVMTPRVRGAIIRRVRHDPKKSIATVAEEVGIPRRTVGKFIQKRGGRSLRRVKVPLISDEGRDRRVVRATALLNDLKSAPKGRIVFFSDEKNFVVDPVYNAQNDRYIRFEEVDNDSGRYLARSKHPAAAMFLGAVASTGETSPPIWFPQGFRLGSEAYIEALKKTLIPWMRGVADAHGSRGRPAPFVWQQDSAPAHRAKKTTDFLRAEKIPFWTPEQWPPNSPDLNPLDYSIWSKVSQGACKSRPKSVTALKARVSRFWSNMPAAEIRAVCRRFRPRLQQCVAEKGSFFD